MNSKNTKAPRNPKFNPFWGLDLGERWGRELGSIDSRLTRLESDVQKLDLKVDMVDGRVDKCLVAINHLDERFNSMRSLIIGVGITVIAGIILQF